MPVESASKRAITFFDGQNLYHSAKAAFGYTYPNYDVQALSEKICSLRGWDLRATRFYTGVPDPSDNPTWQAFWNHKLAIMGRRGIHIYSRSLRYRNRRVRLPDGRPRAGKRDGNYGLDSLPLFLSIFSSRALTATMIVESDIRTAPRAGEIRIPAR